METKTVLEDLAEIPPQLRGLAEDLAAGGVEQVQHRWRRSGSSGRYRARGTDITVGRTDTGADVVMAILALAEEIDAEEGTHVQHQVRVVRDGEPGPWHRFSLAEPGSQDVAQSALRFASHAERVAVRAMGYLEQNLRLQAEMSQMFAAAMLQWGRLELEHERRTREAEARAETSAAALELMERLAPLVAQALARGRSGAGEPS